MAYTDEELAKLSARLAHIDMGETPITNLHGLVNRLRAAIPLAEAAMECGVGKPLWDAYLKASGK